MQISIDDQDMRNAAKRGVEMLTDKNLATPNEWNDDLVALRYILQGVLAGSFKLEPVQSPQLVKGEAHDIHHGEGVKPDEQKKAN